MFDNRNNKEKIIYENDAIKKQVENKRKNDDQKEISVLSKIQKITSQGIIESIKKRIVKYTDSIEKDKYLYSKKYNILPTAINNREDTNYFFNERIAVYTCITGKYDNLIEPHIKPDNIDYFVVTSNEISSDSLWKKIDINNFEEIKDLPDNLKCRYIKLHPYRIFKEYKYSIYVDGNFEIYTDFSEHINRLSKIGFSTFKHCQRKCVYEEIDACKLLHKANDSDIDKYHNRLINADMPKNYGLIETGMLVRKHNDKRCVKIMEDWWNEINSYIHRDQLTLPYVLYKNNVQIDEIATLGNNIRQDYSFEIVSHRK